MYGCLLWDLSCNHVEIFYTAWRKCMRRLLNLPYRTHNVLINAICPGIPAEGIIHNRFIKFMKDSLDSNNACVSLCATLVIRGSRSDVAKSINFICSRYNFDKYEFQNTPCSDLTNAVYDHFITAGAIYDLMYIRERRHMHEFTNIEIQTMIEVLCLQ